MKPEIKDKTWNTVFKCAFCSKWFNMKEHNPNVITMFVGIQSQLDPATRTLQNSLAMQTFTVCDTCFKEYNLREDEPKIISANGALPKIK